MATSRHNGLDWQVLDMCGLLDRLAWRRYLSDDGATARPSWWDEAGGEYPLPAPLKNLAVKPGARDTLAADTRFFETNGTGRTAGGLIALDGVHPTTIGYGILGQAVLDIIRTFPDVAPASDIDFASLVSQDTLVSDPPATLTGDLHVVGWINKHIDIAATLLRRVQARVKCPTHASEMSATRYRSPTALIVFSSTGTRHLRGGCQCPFMGIGQWRVGS